MSKLRDFNNYILNEYKTLENKNDLSINGFHAHS